MINIWYDPKNGLALRDAEVSQYVTDVIKSHDPHYGTSTICISSELIVQEFRTRIKLGEISHDHIKFSFLTDGHEIEIRPDKNGRLEQWPDGFCDYNDKLLDKLIF